MNRNRNTYRLPIALAAVLFIASQIIATPKVYHLRLRSITEGSSISVTRVAPVWHRHDFERAYITEFGGLSMSVLVSQLAISIAIGSLLWAGRSRETD